MSIRPHRSSTLATRALRSANAVTSTRIPTPPAPLGSSSTAAASAAAPSTSAIATCAPSAWSTVAIPAPIPRAPPVTIATCPSSRSMLSRAEFYRVSAGADVERRIGRRRGLGLDLEDRRLVDLHRDEQHHDAEHGDPAEDPRLRGAERGDRLVRHPQQQARAG